MKKLNEIMSDILDTELYEQDDVRACTLYKVPAIKIQQIAVEYAKEVISECIAVPSKIYQEQLKENLP